MNYLDQIKSASDIKKMSFEELNILASDIREFLITHVSQTGGHLASNLGVVEITIAIHNIFDTEKDRLLFDVGHQSYVHKILTGRKDSFPSLRQFGGISGFMAPWESVQDAFSSGHASTALSEALGIARANKLNGLDVSTIAVVGDGSSSGGIFYEGLNDAGASGLPIIVILNDNNMSISRNVGALSGYLSSLRLKPGYFWLKKAYRKILNAIPGGKHIYSATSSMKNWIKRSLIGTTVFEQLGFLYYGPVDGHDIRKLSYLLARAKEENKPVLIHAVTIKGKGYPFAEENPSDYHGVGSFDPQVGLVKTQKTSFSEVFGEELCSLAEKNSKICAITAAMPEGTGLSTFRERFPTRFFDVGITEEHAVSMASGMAMQGSIPVVAIYSTFLQRAYDNILQDAALNNLHVVFCIDRCGLVGEDGATHHGMFDVGYLTSVPGITVLSPSNYQELRSAIRFAVDDCVGPVAVRYPRGSEPAYRDISSKQAAGEKDLLMVTYGSEIGPVSEAAEILEHQGYSVSIFKPLCIKPLDFVAFENAVRNTTCCLIVEEQSAFSSIAGEITTYMLENKIYLPVGRISAGDRYIPHGSTQNLRSYAGLDAESIVRKAEELIRNGK